MFGLPYLFVVEGPMLFDIKAIVIEARHNFFINFMADIHCNPVGLAWLRLSRICDCYGYLIVNFNLSKNL